MKYRFKVGDKVRFLNDTGGGIITRIDEKGLVHVEAEDGFEIPALPSDIIPAGGFDAVHLEEGTGPNLSDLGTGTGVSAHRAGPATPGTKAEPSVPASKAGRSESASESWPHAANGGTVSATIAEPSLPANIVDSELFDILVGFVPEHPGPVFSSQLDCFLINDSDYHAYYRLGTSIQGNLHHLSSGMIEANTKYLINTYNHTELSKISAMHLQLLWISSGRYTKKPAVDRMIDLGSVNFAKESFYFENAYFDEKAVLFSAMGYNKKNGKPGKDTKEDLSNLKKAMTSEDQVARGVKRPMIDTMEIDLHIDKLIEDANRYSAGEILAMQLKKLDETMADAISKKMRRLVIIHGVGQGTLKMQIRRELQEKYPEYQFQDASFREYGFGATLVHLHTIRKQ